jgi:uncharacterized glyoxalase superfamily protein PhnB
MSQFISGITLLVHNQDKAIEFFTSKLSFHLLEDTIVSPTKRWVVVAPSGKGNCAVILSQANSKEQNESVGNQTAGKVFAVIKTDTFDQDVARMMENGISFVRGPEVAPWGKVVVFKDLYGNLWDLVGTG